MCTEPWRLQSESPVGNWDNFHFFTSSFPDPFCLKWSSPFSDFPTSCVWMPHAVRGLYNRRKPTTGVKFDTSGKTPWTISSAINLCDAFWALTRLTVASVAYGSSLRPPPELPRIKPSWYSMLIGDRCFFWKSSAEALILAASGTYHFCNNLSIG